MYPPLTCTVSDPMVQLVNKMVKDNWLPYNLSDDFRHKAVKSGGATIVNTYNGKGLRVAKEVDGVKTQYLYEMIKSSRLMPKKRCGTLYHIFFYIHENDGNDLR